MHTPGPWTVDDECSVCVSVDGADYVISVEPRFYARPLLERDANARLIAAAPDLLKCLKDWVSDFADSCEGGELVEFSRAAIAKAEGRT